MCRTFAGIDIEGIILSDEKVSPVPTVIISIASLLTAIVVIAFIILFSVKGVSDLKLNEIGDSLAGPSGLLAFIWLLTTVMLQNHEMASLRSSSQTQANSLDISAQIQLATHLRALQDDYLDYILQRNNHCEAELARFFTNHGDYIDPEGLARNKYEAVPWLVSEFMRDDIQYTGEISELVSDNMREKFEYNAYLTVDVLHSAMREVADVVNILRRFAKKANMVDEQKAWESSLKLSWYEKRCKMVEKVYSESRLVIAKGGIANEFVTTFIKAYSADPIEEIVWSSI